MSSGLADPPSPKFLPEVCRAIQDEFTREYLGCPTTPDEWKELEKEFRIRWNVPHALGALDGKHVARKKPKNIGALKPKLQGILFNSNVGLGRWTVQVQMG